MAGKLQSLEEEWPEGEVQEEAEGEAISLKKAEDLLAMVKKLQKEGHLEPQIKDLIIRINELQQAKKSSEELGDVRALQETLHRDLESLNEETVHLEEVLSKKQETLMTLKQHCPQRKSEAQWFDIEGCLEELTSQHKDLWEFHMLAQRLAQEIQALELSREQALGERTRVIARLQEVERRLSSAEDVEGAPGLKTESETFGGQTQSAPDAWIGEGEVGTRRMEAETRERSCGVLWDRPEKWARMGSRAFLGRGHSEGASGEWTGADQRGGPEGAQGPSSPSLMAAAHSLTAEHMEPQEEPPWTPLSAIRTSWKPTFAQGLPGK